MFTCYFKYEIRQKDLKDKRRPIILSINAELKDNFVDFDTTPLSLRVFEINNVEDVVLQIKRKATKLIRYKMELKGEDILRTVNFNEPGQEVDQVH